MNSISEDNPRIFRTDDGELLSRPAPVLAISVENDNNRSKIIPIGQYDDYLSFADIATGNKIKAELAKAAFAEPLNDNALLWPSDEGTTAAMPTPGQLAYQVYLAKYHPEPPPAPSITGHDPETYLDPKDKAELDKLLDMSPAAPPAPPGSLPSYKVTLTVGVPPPALVNKPKVALGEKLRRIVALNSKKKSTPEADKWAEANAFNAERVQKEQDRIDKWVSAIDQIAYKNNMSTKPYKQADDF